MFSFSNKRQEDINPATMVNGNTSGASQPSAKMEGANTPQKLNEDEYIENRVAEIERQHQAFLQKKPDFDMKTELQNDTFVGYIWKNGLSVEDAYLLTHRDEVVEEAVADAIKRIQDRRNRISENGAGKNSPVSVKKNPKEMSDKEIDSIIERVRNGEKISF